MEARARKRILAGVVVAMAGVALAVRARWRKNPTACPYGVGFLLDTPRPFITRSRLREIMAPMPGERVLEVGAGTGHYSLHTARWIEPGGMLYVFDLQQQMLDQLMRGARELGISNMVPARGDAQDLPYPDDHFDAGYMITVLGEVSDQGRVLRELRRVLKPGGRLIVGEVFPDPHMVTFGMLQERAEEAGLHFERRVGGRLGYYARFGLSST